MIYLINYKTKQYIKDFEAAVKKDKLSLRGGPELSFYSVVKAEQYDFNHMEDYMAERLK